MKLRKKQSKKSRQISSREAHSRRKLFRRALQMETLEDRIVLDGEGVPYFIEPIPGPAGAGVPSGIQYFPDELNHAGSGARANTAPGAEGAVNPSAPTIVLDFNEPAQADTTDMFGNVVTTFDPTDFGFTAADFDLLATGILDEVSKLYFDIPTTPLTPIPAFHELDVNFIIGEIGTAPAGFSEYYFMQVGTEVGTPSGALGLACLGCVRDATGNGPNLGVQIGDVVGSVFSNTFGFDASLTSGNFDATTSVVGYVAAHELGHSVSLEHLNVAGSITPLGIGTPVMATGAIDATTADFLGEHEFALSGMNAEQGGQTQMHVQQLIDALGTRLDALVQAEGTVYQDDNENGVQDAGEIGLAGWEVYFDIDNNGALDAGEPVTISATDGTYTLSSNDGAGTYTVREVVQPGYLPTVPVGGVTSVTFSQAVETITGVHFGNVEDPAVISGFKWIDNNLDGRYDSDTEPPGAGFRIYIDENNNERLDFNERSTLTGEDGTYSITAPGAGTYLIREAIPPGYTLTFPTDGKHEVTLAEFESAKNLDFGNSGQLHDFGNAPDTYGTSLADDGPRHRMLPGLQMGANLEGEADALNASTADNDGVSFAQRIVAGSTASFDVEVMTSGQTPAYIHAWVDFDGSGTFESSEQIVANDRRGDGTHTLSFAVPSAATTGQTWARVRYGWEYNLGPSGEAFVGEVEDVLVNVLGDDPQAVDDFFDGTNAVPQDSAAVNLDVLANDFASSAGGLMVQSVQNPSDQNGIVTIAGNGLSVFYQPAAGFFGSDSFTYTIVDAANKTSMATVSVVVTPTISGPLALDDVHFFTDFPLNASTDIPVLQNDFNGANGPIRLNQITVDPALGTAVISNNGTADPSDDVIQYTPINNTVEGMTDQLEYEIIDTLNQTSTASVLIQIGNATANDTVIISLAAFDPNTGQPIASTSVGEVFELRGFVSDNRAQIPPPPNGAELNGLFSSYFDVTVNKPTPASNAFSATFVGQLASTAEYPEATNGDTLSPGQIDEVGGVQPVQIGGQLQGHGRGPIHMFTQSVRADQAGNIIFQPNPSDNALLLTLFFEPADIVPVDQITFLPLSIIATAAGGEGEAMPGDVNGNGRIERNDTFALIAAYGDQRAEGEDSANQDRMDVNRDGTFDLRDVLASINYLQATQGRGGGEGEGGMDLSQLTSNPLGSVLAQSVLSEPVLVDQTSPIAVNEDDRREPLSSWQHQPSVVVSGESQSEEIRYAAGDSDSVSVLDRDWIDEIGSTLDDDLLLDISSSWKNDDE